MRWNLPYLLKFFYTFQHTNLISFLSLPENITLQLYTVNQCIIICFIGEWINFKRRSLFDNIFIIFFSNLQNFLLIIFIWCSCQLFLTIRISRKAFTKRFSIFRRRCETARVAADSSSHIAVRVNLKKQPIPVVSGKPYSSPTSRLQPALRRPLQTPSRDTANQPRSALTFFCSSPRIFLGIFASGARNKEYIWLK